MSILEMSAAASALIGAVLILRWLAFHRLPKGTFLALWWVAVIRLLIPFSIPSRFSVYTALDRLEQTTAAAAPPANLQTPPTLVAPPVVSPGPVEPVPDWSVPFDPVVGGDPAGMAVEPLALVYLLGAAVCVLSFTAAYLRCRRRFGTALPVDSPFLAAWRSGRKIPVRIKESDRITAPLTYGLFRPVVLMPKGTDWRDEEGLGYVLAHEYVHIRRGDLWMKLALAACLCVHWFNPLVWLLYRLANRDMELACDEAVVRTFGLEARPAYAMSLIKWEESRRGFMPLCGNFSKTAMEERVTAVMKVKRHSRAAVLIAVALVAALTGAFATSCAPKGEEMTPIQPPAQSQEDKSDTSEPAKSEGPVVPDNQPEEENGPIQLPEDPLEEQPGALDLPEDETKPVSPAQLVEETKPQEKPKPEKPKSAYPVNSQGHTYGVWTEENGYEDVPDLIYFRVDEATEGYVKREDVYPYSYPVKTAEEKERYLDWCERSSLPHEDSYFCHRVTVCDQEERAVSAISTVVQPSGIRKEDLGTEADRGNILRPILPMSFVPAEDIPAGRRTEYSRNLNHLSRSEREWLKENTVDGDWPRNSAGETYGPVFHHELVGYVPDLLAVGTRNGDSGYVRYEDFEYPGYPRTVVSVADQTAYKAWSRLQREKVAPIPVYDLKGNRVGQFEMASRDVIRTEEEYWEDIEQIKEDLKGGGWTDEEIEKLTTDYLNFKKGRGW